MGRFGAVPALLSAREPGSSHGSPGSRRRSWTKPGGGRRRRKRLCWRRACCEVGLGWHRRHRGEVGGGGSGAPQPDAGLCFSPRHGGVRRGGDGAAHPHLTAPPGGSHRAGELQNMDQGSCPVAVPSRSLCPPLTCPVCARRLGASGSCWLLAWAGGPRRHRCRWLGSASCRRRGRASCRPIATSRSANGSRRRPRQPVGCPADPSPSSSVPARGHKTPPRTLMCSSRGVAASWGDTEAQDVTVGGCPSPVLLP